MTSLPDLPAHQGARSLDKYGEIVRAALTRSIVGMIEAGRELHAAKEEHPSEFVAWVPRALGFSVDTAERLMRLGTALGSLDSATLRNLPADRTTLYELSRLKIPQLKQAIEAGEVSPNTARADAESLVNRLTPAKPGNVKSTGAARKHRRATSSQSPDGEEPGVPPTHLNMCALWLIRAARAGQGRDLADAIDEKAQEDGADVAAVADLLGDVAQELRGRS